MGLVEDFAKFLEGSNRMISDPLGEAEKKIANMSAEDKEKLKKKIASGKEKNPKKTGEGLKEGDSTDFGMLSVKAGIDNNPKPTQADRIAGATKNEKKTVKAKDGSRTKVRGTGAAKKGFRKAKLS